MYKQILIFAHDYRAPFLDVNNQYTDCFDLTQHEVTVVYLSGQPDEKIRNQHRAQHVIFLNQQTKRGLKLSIIQKMQKLCKEKQFDIIICHRYKPSYIILWTRLIKNKPLIFFVMHELRTLQSMMRKLTVALLFRKNMRLVGVSEAVKKDLQQSVWRIPDNQIIHLPNALDYSHTEAHLLDRCKAREELRLSATDFIFGQLGRLVENKDQSTLIRAFALVKKVCPVAKLVIIGDGRLAPTLNALIKELGLINEVLLLGFIPDAFRYLKAFDVYVSSSVQEAFGRVLLEAMCASLPIVATAVHGVPEVMGHISQLVPPKHPAELATEMIKTYHLSAADRLSRGQEGYERLTKEFSVNRFKQLFWHAVEAS